MQTYICAQMHTYSFSKVWGTQEEGLFEKGEGINSLCKLWDHFAQCSPLKD